MYLKTYISANFLKPFLCIVIYLKKKSEIYYFAI